MKRLAVFFVLLMTGSATMAYGETFLKVLDEVVKAHPELNAAEFDLASSQQNRAAKFRSIWAPQLEVRYGTGPQWYKSADSQVDTDMTAEQFEARIEQRVFDFGKSTAELDADKFIINQSESNVDMVRQGLMMAAFDAILQVQRAESLLKFASQSKENIQQQTKMENIMLEEGRGFSSNVLQAKAQLAGAEARRISARSDLDVAYAKLYAIFGERANELDLSREIVFPKNLLPQTLEEAIAVAVRENPRIKVGHYRSKTLRKKVAWEHRKAYYPDINLTGRIARDKDYDGAAGTRHDDSVMAEVKMPFNLGLAGSRYKQVALHNAEASERQEAATRRDVIENTKIAWHRLQTARENRRILVSKVEIAANFLKLAQEERQSGRRSLLEVLTAETTLYDAQGEAAAALTNEIHSKIDLLFAMGRLSIEHMRGRAR